MALYDYAINFGELRVDKDEGYEIERSSTRELPYPNNYWNAVTYEVS